MSQVSSLLRHLNRLIQPAAQPQRAERAVNKTRAATADIPNMEGYTSTVVRPAEPKSMPKDGADQIHHVVKNGRVTGFKNPYPSWGEGNGLSEIFAAVVW